MFVPNSHGNCGGVEQDCGPEKPLSSVAHGEKVGAGLGKPISGKASSFTFPSPASSEGLKTHIASLSPTPSSRPLPMPPNRSPWASPPPASTIPPSRPSSATSPAAGQQQQAVSYHATLPQHLLIPSGQPLLVPVSSSGGGEQEPPHSVVTSHQQIAVSASHSYVATAIPKCELVGVSEQQVTGAYPATATAGGLVQAQLHLPVPAAPAPLLPPYFMKGSIIQLADGELKRVEDLRTEDFIQSADISGELKIDSSTVERIDGSPTPTPPIIQFAVGEHRVQVSVEVLVEYPFFVFGQGWSSCCPDRTTQLFELSCTKLSVGDVCISLTLKNLKNGSLRKSQNQAAGFPLKPPKVDGQHRDRGGVTAGSRRMDWGSGQGGVGGRAGGHHH
ncbi:hypothetical protein SKAU_G00219150 [Synaphobranchus kaupii]|uniref:AXH domain-containing protein n=1 Tax=Synaphobranchus kaupii TaxID=118154 RepID=A0A9Q1IVV2_SYNKA|nr:hypothetical protein SKAU_G00219150 [Synaphobranchus kaupii]